MPTPTFFTLDAAVSTTAAKVVDAVDFDRSVVARSFEVSPPSDDNVYIGYSSSDVNFRLPDAGQGSTAVPIILPAGKELWAKSGSGSPSLHLFVGGSPG